MTYELVLQSSADSMADFDRLVALENQIEEQMGEMADIDGHDFGLREFNIFILTDDPVSAFTEARRIVLREGVPNHMRSRYRKMDSEDYLILWPSTLRQFTVS